MKVHPRWWVAWWVGQNGGAIAGKKTEGVDKATSRAEKLRDGLSALEVDRLVKYRAHPMRTPREPKRPRKPGQTRRVKRPEQPPLRMCGNAAMELAQADATFMSR